MARGARRFQGMNELELLRWATRYLEGEVRQLRGSYGSPPGGRIQDAKIRREVADLEAWLARVLELAPPFTHTTKPPAIPSRGIADSRPDPGYSSAE